MWRVEAGLSPVESIFELDTEDLKTQFVAGSLGNGRPLDRARYRQTFGVSIDDDFGKRLERLRGAALLEDDRERIVLTETGMLVYDRVLLCFYPERAKGWLRSRIASPRRAGPG